MLLGGGSVGSRPSLVHLVAHLGEFRRELLISLGEPEIGLPFTRDRGGIARFQILHDGRQVIAAR
jgi:hypothetical protein